jgi:hypothetical protein
VGRVVRRAILGDASWRSGSGSGESRSGVVIWGGTHRGRGGGGSLLSPRSRSTAAVQAALAHLLS